jgi:hypothetical protein
MSGKYAVAVGLAVALAIGLGGVATAGKSGRNQIVKDPTDKGGKFYDAETYARCDIKEVKATVKRGKLVVKVTHRGKQASSSHQLNLNTKGGKTSDPEYYLRRDFDGASLTKVKDLSTTPDAAKVKLKNKKKALQYELPLRKIGRPKKTGFQAQTCGEGAVDIAPGGSYYDDVKWDGTIDYKYKNIKTGS